MKLLVITQAVDKNNTTLAFFQSWLREMSKRAEKVTVICLHKGQYDLPENVTVLSLGKEFGFKKSSYIKNFFKYIWKCRGDYDTVFVHMNQEYILLGGLFWQVFGKKVFFWRNHPHGDRLTEVAVFLSDTVFCTSTESFTARFPKTKIMPVGVDTGIFRPDTTADKKPHSLLMFGRVSPVKYIDKAISAVSILHSRGVHCTLDIVGDAPIHDTMYRENLEKQVADLHLEKIIFFKPGVLWNEASSIYNSHHIFLNLTTSGSFDKTIIEAMACGNLVLTSNSSMQSVLPEENICQNEPEDIAEKLEKLLQMSKATFDTSEYVQKHSLTNLMDELFEEMK